MKTKTGNRILKILCIAAVFVLMLILSGCRTRISNNNEVNNVMYDDGGYMQEEYDMRREDLDLSTAKKPVFTGFGNPEEEEDEDYDFGEDGQALEDYEPDEFEDEVDDSNPPLPNSSTTTTPGTGTVKRRVITNNAPVVITVTLNPNGGKCKTKTLAVRKDGKYGILPTPTRDDYTFTGWYTKKEDGKGKKVTSTTKVASTTNHTLYAHWKKGEEKKEEDTKPADTTPTTPTTPTDPTPTEPEKPEEPAKKYTVTFNPNGGSGGGTTEVEKGGKYKLPSDDPIWDGYKFDGWYTSTDGGDHITSDSTFNGDSDQELFAHWKDDPEYYYNIWNDDLKNAVQSLDSKKKYKIHNGEGGELLQDSGLKKGEEDFDILVYFGTKEDAAEEIDTSDGKLVLVVPKEARKGSLKDNSKLLYKLKIFNAVYSGYDIDTAASELEVTDSEEVGFLD